MSQGETYRRVRLEFDEDMTPKSSSSTSPKDCKLRALGIWPARTVVPVIFIPGIMGTNLSNNGEKAWVPPNGTVKGLGELKRRRKQSPADRQKQLTPDKCEVYEANDAIKIPDTYTALDEVEAKRRHWGEVHADSYLEILLKLEETLNHPFDGAEYGDNPDPAADWKQAMNPKKKWKPKSPLTEAEFKDKMGQIYFPVYACGYNWMQSNEKSAQRVVERVMEIEARLAGHGYFSYSGKVILVTHSMGGLVGRRAVQLKALEDKVLGVFHGVQPVTGAPAVYRRFKAGTETNGLFDLAGAAAAVVLGWDAADVTCVLANSPGPMELLPTTHYEKEWLHITNGERTVKLPKEDPYKEIYEVSVDEKWWGMVDPALIDPAGKITVSEEQTIHGHFKSLLNKAKEFHETIKLTCHRNTYAHYGDDETQKSLPAVVWRTSEDLGSMTDEDLLGAKRTKAKLTGRTEVEIKGRKITFSPDGKDGAGDGTVPTCSGAAVGKLKDSEGEDIKDVFKLDGFEHASSYHDKIARQTAIYAIGKMTQAVTLKEDGTCERS